VARARVNSAETSGRDSDGDDRRARVTPISEPGVVLLDVVLALAIVLMAARIAWPLLPTTTSPARLTAWSHEVAALIEFDRVTAARRGRPVVTRIDVRDRRFVGGANGQVVKLPRDVTLDIVTTADCTLDGDRFALGFAPDGRSCGMAAALRGPAGVAVQVTVNWLTGLVEVTGGVRGRG
jgi:Tfp pilus assembly protein FimT